MSLRKTTFKAWNNLAKKNAEDVEDNQRVANLAPGQFSISTEPVTILGKPEVKFEPGENGHKRMTLTVDFIAREQAAGAQIPLTYDCGVFEDAPFEAPNVDLRVEFDGRSYVYLVLEVGTPAYKGRYGG